MTVDQDDDGNGDIQNYNYVVEMIEMRMTMMLLMTMIKIEKKMMTMRMMMRLMTATIAMIMVLAGFLSPFSEFLSVHVFTLAQMERDRRRGRTPAVRGTLAPQPATTRVRTPATAGRTRLQ